MRTPFRQERVVLWRAQWPALRCRSGSIRLLAVPPGQFRTEASLEKGVPLKLTESQAAALAHVREYALARRTKARATLQRVLLSSGTSAEAHAAGLASILNHARVVLHFHPDRQGTDLKTVAQGLLAAGVYRNQFETRISNGSVSAHPGGERDRWESGLYGGAYDLPGSTPDQRPKYGALDLLRHPDGPAPRFGSCYLVLKAEVSERCTFSYRDSHLNPEERGTLDVFEDVMAGLMSEVLEHGSGLGERKLTVSGLVQHVARQLEGPYLVDVLEPSRRNLDAYIEAQVHGAVRLEHDAEWLVADPSFRGSETGLEMERICEEWGLGLQWHAGFAMNAADTSAEFRGPDMPALAQRVAIDGRVNAHAIGRAVRSLREDPGSWRERGTRAEVLQELKLLWHVLVHQGQPEARA